MSKLRSFYRVLLITLLNISLIHSSFVWAGCSYNEEDDPTLYAQKEACDEKSGQEWVCELNRCMNTQDAVDTREAFQKCEEMEDEDERKACHDQVAKDAVEREHGDITSYEKPDATTANMVYTASLTLAIMNWVAKGKLSKGGCMCQTIFLAAAVAAIAAELYSHYVLDKELTELTEKYEKEATKDNPHDAQVRAFEYLKEEQETVADVADKKATAYMILTGLYAAAGAMALYESWKGTCGTGGDAKTGDGDVQPSDNATNGDVQKPGGTSQPPTNKRFEPINMNVTLQSIHPDTPATDSLFIYQEFQMALEGKTYSPSIHEYEKIKAKSELKDLNPQEQSYLNQVLKHSIQLTMKMGHFIIPAAYADSDSDDDSDSDSDDAKSDDDESSDGFDLDLDLSENNALFMALIGVGGGVALGYLAKHSETLQQITDWLTSPAGIAIISGIAAILSYQLYEASKELSEDAKKNAELIQQTADAFGDVTSGYCPSRDDLNNPECYCYTEDGEKNTDRTNSATCQNLWASKEKNYHVGASDYKDAVGEVTLGCMDLNGNWDATCECKKLTNSKGENACYKSNMPSTTIGGMGTALDTTSLGNSADGITQGDLSTGALSATDANQQASRARKVRDQLLDQINKQRKKQGKPPIDLQSEKLKAGLISSLADDNLLNMARKGPLGAAFGSKRPDNPNIKKAIKKSGIKKTLYQKNTPKKSGAGKKEDEFDFKFGRKSPNASAGTVKNFMKKKYKYKGSDINGSHVSLWEVISRRYQVSGLRRLFADDEKKEK